MSAISLPFYALLVGRNWLQWHGAYDDPESSLSHRLATVTTMIRDHVDTAPSGGIRCVSLCTGECPDLPPAHRPRTESSDSPILGDDTHRARTASNMDDVAAVVDVLLRR